MRHSTWEPDEDAARCDCPIPSREDCAANGYPYGCYHAAERSKAPQKDEDGYPAWSPERYCDCVLYSAHGATPRHTASCRVLRWIERLRFSESEWCNARDPISLPKAATPEEAEQLRKLFQTISDSYALMSFA